MNNSLKIILAVLLILAVANLLVVTASLLLLVFAGVLFGILLDGISCWLAAHTPMSRRVSCTLVLLTIIAVSATGIWYMGSQLTEQVTELTQQLNTSGQKVMERLDQIPGAPDQKQLEKMVPASNQLFPKITNGLKAISWGLTGAAVIFFVGAYLAFSPDSYRSGIVRLVPPEDREQARSILDQLRSVLGRWILGRIVSMTVIGVTTAVGLALLQVPLPIPLGVLAGLLTFIPNIGPLLAAVPQALLAFQVGSDTVLWVLLFNLGLQTVESYLLTPMIDRHEVSLPPALTITVQLVFGATIGIVGVMMAAPLTAAVMVLVQQLYVHNKLRDMAPAAPADS